MCMQRIQEFTPKIKTLADNLLAEWGIFLIIILSAVGSFGLGRLSALEASKPLIGLQEASLAPSVAPITQGGMVVASRTGESYYFPWCSGASKILPINQRVFVSADAAKKAGLRPSKTCKGLN